MKRLKSIYNNLLNIERIKKSVLKTSRGRCKQLKIKTALEHLNEFAEKIRDRFEKKDFNLGKIIEQDIIEGSKNKPRHIAYLDDFSSQCMLATAFDFLADKITKISYSNSYGSLPKRGIHRAKRFIERWLRTDRKHTKYFCKADIKQCFPNANHEAVKDGYKKIFKDKDLISFFDALVDSYCDKDKNGIRRGLPIGFLSSPWFIHILLTPLDFEIKQIFKIKHYIRFMDDFILFDSNKRKIRKAVEYIDKRLSEYGLWLKPNWEVRETDEAPFDYVGFKFYREKTTLRRSIAQNIIKTTSRVKHKYSPTLVEAREILSYNGWLYSTNSHRFFKKFVEPFIHIKSARRVISNSAKKEKLLCKNTNLNRTQSLCQ